MKSKFGYVKLALALVAVLIAVASVFAVRYASERHVERWSEKLALLASLRSGALHVYFDTVRAEVTFWSLTDEILLAQRDFLQAWEVLENEARDRAETLRTLYIDDNRYPFGTRHRLFDAGDGSDYSEVHRRFHASARPIVHERGYYDFFLISPDGDILYTVEKESDFGTNLGTGPWRDSGLGHVYRRALARLDQRATVFSDMAAYAPSEGDPAIFAATAIVDAQGDLLGVLAVQVPTEPIQSIMQFTAGMGASGETYLVGEDRMMRSESRFSENSTILKLRVDTPTVAKGLAGETGVDWTDDYRGIEVLSAYGRFARDGIVWAVMAEVDADEVFDSVAMEGWSIAGMGLLLWILSAWTAWYLGRAEVEGLDELAFGATDPLGTPDP